MNRSMLTLLNRVQALNRWLYVEVKLVRLLSIVNIFCVTIILERIEVCACELAHFLYRWQNWIVLLLIN